MSNGWLRLHIESSFISIETTVSSVEILGHLISYSAFLEKKLWPLHSCHLHSPQR